MKLATARVTALVLFTSIALLFWAIVETRSRPTTSELESRKDHLLPEFDSFSVQKLTISRPGRDAPPLVLVRKDEETDLFLLGDEHGRGADPGISSALLRALDRQKVQRRYDAPDDALLGRLAQPDFEVTIVARGRTTRLLLSQGQGYLVGKVSTEGGEPSYVALDSSLSELLSHGPKELTVRALFPIPKSETAELALSRSQPPGAVRLRPSAFGFSFAEKGQRADRDLVDAIFFQLAQSELVTIVDRKEVEARQALADVLFTVEQRGKSGGVSEVRFGGRCDAANEEDTRVLALELSGDERAGCASGSILAALSVEPTALEDRSLLPLRADEIDHVVIETEAETIDLIRKDSAFEVSDARGRRSLDAETGRRLLLALTSARGIPVSTEKGPDKGGAGTKTLRVVGHGPSDLVIDEKVMLNSEGDRLLATRADGVTLSLSPKDASPIVEAGLWLEDKKLDLGTAEAIEELSFRTQKETRKFVRSPEGFRAAPDGRLADARLVEDWLDVLTHLEAAAFLPPEKAPAVASLTIEVRLASEPQPRSLRVFGRETGGVRATLDGVPFPFLIDPGLLERLTRSLEDRTPASLDLEQATRVVLEATQPSPRQVELKRIAGELLAVSERPLLLRSDDLRALLENLNPLWALPDLTAPPSTPPLLSILVETTVDRAPQRLRFYKVPSQDLRAEGDVVAFTDRSRFAFVFEETALKRVLGAF